jgi:hypothetical protein
MSVSSRRLTATKSPVSVFLVVENMDELNKSMNN